MSPAADWDEVASAWELNSARFERAVQGVTLELLGRSALFPGQAVLDLACGPGGMLPLIAELVEPGGSVIAGDASAGMVEAARRLVDATGLRGVEVGQLDIDWLDLETASIGALICRFGYMFASDPAAALVEARRVIRPGGTIATAVWDVPDVNPYGAIPLQALVEVGLGDPPTAGEPGMFRLSEPQAVSDLLRSAGFTEVEHTAVDVAFGYESNDDLLEWVTSLSSRIVGGLAGGVGGSSEQFALELGRLVAPWAEPGSGRIVLPGRAIVASGRA